MDFKELFNEAICEYDYDFNLNEGNKRLTDEEFEKIFKKTLEALKTYIDKGGDVNDTKKARKYISLYLKRG